MLPEAGALFRQRGTAAAGNDFDRVSMHAVAGPSNEEGPSVQPLTAAALEVRDQVEELVVGPFSSSSLPHIFGRPSLCSVSSVASIGIGDEAVPPPSLSPTYGGLLDTK